MKIARTLLAAIVVTTAFFLAGCASDEAPLATGGTKFYTKCNLFHENRVHPTTNYQKGIMVPVNTEVTFVESDDSVIVVALPDGAELKLRSIEDYSGESVAGIFNRTLGKTKVDLTKFPKLDRDGIAGAAVAPGMSKDAVVIALGYPPRHRTPSLASDSWRYWRNRFNTFIVRFEDGKVTEIVE